MTFVLLCQRRQEGGMRHSVHQERIFQGGGPEFIILSHLTQRGDGIPIVDPVGKAATPLRLFTQIGRIDLFTHFITLLVAGLLRNCLGATCPEFEHAIGWPGGKPVG
jgi:hypothetical protein